MPTLDAPNSDGSVDGTCVVDAAEAPAVVVASTPDIFDERGRGRTDSGIARELLKQAFDRPASKRPRHDAPSVTDDDSIGTTAFLAAAAGTRASSTEIESREAAARSHNNLVADLPLDWSIKRRVRFTSQTRFDWTKNPKSASAAQALSGYARRSDAVPTDHSTAFQHALFFYEHPLQGWPKALTDAAQRFGLGGSSAKAKANEAYVGQLFDDWTAAIMSLYQLLRAGQLPYVGDAATLRVLLPHTHTLVSLNARSLSKWQVALGGW